MYVFHSGIAVGSARLTGVEYKGTLFVKCCSDNDWIGVVFSFQVSLKVFLEKIFWLKCDVSGHF